MSSDCITFSSFIEDLFALRPVVSLKSEIMGTKVANGTWELSK